MQVSRGSVFAPVVADAAGGVVENPEVGGGCFSGPRGEEGQWSFVSLQVVGGEGLVVNRFCDGGEKLKAVQGPVIEGVARDADPTALEDALLAIKWEVVGVFSDDEVGDEVDAGEASY